MNERLTELAQKLRNCPDGWHCEQRIIIANAIDEINRVQSEIINGLAERVAVQSELLSRRAEKQ